MKYVLKIFELEQYDIPYQVIKTKNKSLTLRFSRDIILMIRIPSYAKDEQVIDFIHRHLDWISKNYEKMKTQKVTYQNGSEYLYLGNKYHLSIIISNHEGVYIKNDTLIVYTKQQTKTKEVLENWKKEKAEVIFNEMLFSCFQKMQKYLDFYPKLEIKHYLSRWGCCYPKRKLIILNLSLIHVDLDLIEFVVFHELTHFRYPHHQSDFHTFLQFFCPLERSCKKRLKNYQTLID